MRKPGYKPAKYIIYIRFKKQENNLYHELRTNIYNTICHN